MSLQSKLLSDITEDDLQELLANPIAERKTMEYKLSLPNWNYDEEKKEFLADVSSFANASGGHLLLGVKEEDGMPVELPGIHGVSPDDAKQTIENLIRDCIEPRIWGYSLEAIPLQNSGIVIILRIPRSWNLPHVVRFRKHWRFYSRNSAGKYPLDVSELRTLFEFGGTTADRIRDFRAERLGRIVAEEAPVALREDAKIVLHIVPFTAFDPSARIDLFVFRNDLRQLAPISARGWDSRPNFDGYLTYRESQYVQVFRNGSIEAVDTRLFYESSILLEYESELLDAISRFISLQRNLGIEPPLFLMLSLIGVSGYVMDRHHFQHRIDQPHPIDRDALIIPEIMVDSFDHDLTQILKPAFDAVWNAAGWPCSVNYDQDGNWKGQH